MPRPELPAPPQNVVTARLPDGRYLVAHLDPNLAQEHSPLQRALAATNTTQAPGEGEAPQTKP